MLDSIKSVIAAFFKWWGQELLGLVPGFLIGKSSTALPRQILSIESKGLRLIDQRNAKAALGDGQPGEPISVTEISDRLSSTRSVIGKPEIGLRLNYQACFVRRVELPSAAASDFPQLLAIDLERATPFKSKDVYTAYTVDKASNRSSKVSVRHLVIKRSAVESFINILQSAGRKVTHLDCWAEEGGIALPVNFLDASLSTGRAPGRSLMLPKLLGATAVILAAIAAYLVIDRHDSALADLQTQTARLKVRVQTARDAAARSQTLLSEVENFRRLRTTVPSKAAALEELTRLLPDTAWVTDLKIDGSSVDIAGLATSAVSLIPILERSAFFVDATSTAPLTFDQREDKERFSIRVKIRSAVVAEATRSPEVTK